LKFTGRDGIKEACITVLGAGYLPAVPGTWGSAFAVAIHALIGWLLRISAAPATVIEAVTLAGILGSAWLSVAWGRWAIERFGRKDPGQFVLDEFAGQWVALLWLAPLATVGLAQFAWVVGGQFVLFRILDVIKPPPARQLERLPAGWGILCDDLMSGCYALVIGQLIWRVSPAAEWLGL
jgi:phosphatidylglycerophosphatase A